ncbi:MAG: hypothetical protein U0521_26685 [Anaerolineae bacterium]
MLLLLNDPDLRQRMGEDGRARVERLFSAGTMAVQFDAALKNLEQ